MSEIQLFEFERKLVRTIIIDDQVWFVAKDVCESLDIAWRSNTLDAIKPEWKGMRNLRTPAGTQPVTIISEPAIYKLAFRSRKPEAERFTDWIAEEVLPQIRQSGGYVPKRHGILPMVLHTDVSVQKAMSKYVNTFNYRRGGKKSAINHNIQNCKAHSGKTPKQLMTLGKQKGLKTRQRKSGKEVLRQFQPEAACSMSLADNLIEQGYNPQKVFTVTPNANAVFKGMLELGATPPELNQLEKK